MCSPATALIRLDLPQFRAPAELDVNALLDTPNWTLSTDNDDCGVGIQPGAESSAPRSNGVEPSGEIPSDLLIGPDGQDCHLPRLSDRCSEGSVGPNTKPTEHSE
ncbi:unnamed protein product [Phytophthora fragariaefolia]|uniref:Unnamed protein product n=1 Tax=Phytophthora fragariaefolia TaxID=1490495 RepID=A0A9W7D5M2_9STRA|nr:unnamed protein product [Phytophthora fragariaefolia]